MSSAAERQTALGRVTQCSSSFEFVLSGLLCAATGMSGPRAFVVSAHAGARSILGMLRSLSKLPDAPVTGPDFDKWLKQAEIALTSRNRIIHSAWLQVDGRMQRMDARRAMSVDQPIEDVLSVADQLIDVALGARPWLPITMQVEPPPGYTGPLPDKGWPQSD